MSGIGHKRNQGDRFALKDDLTFHAFLGHIKAVEQYMDKTEGIIAKSKKMILFIKLTSDVRRERERS
jgi:hypothetical protein